MVRMSDQSLDLAPEIEAALPFLSGLDSHLRSQFSEQGTVQPVEAGQFIFMENDPVGAFGFVVSGSARVYKLSETGREITLYRVDPGEACVLSASCIMNHGAYPAYAVAETDMDVLLIPAEVFSGWVAQHDFWRDYVFALVARHISSVMSLVEEVAFRRVDHRTAELLLKSPGDEMEATHQEIAAELGTSREVVSRILKDLERKGCVALSRGKVTVLDRAQLEGFLPVS
jgi:CRP/FNR family transcriptional regulator, anaerobic regulatory protein